MTNPYDTDETLQLNMTKFNFMPSLDINTMSGKLPEKFDIYSSASSRT